MQILTRVEIHSLEGRVSPCPSRYSHIYSYSQRKSQNRKAVRQTNTHTHMRYTRQTAHGHLGNSLSQGTRIPAQTSTRHVPGCTLHFTLTTHCPHKHRMHSSPCLRTVSNRITSLLSHRLCHSCHTSTGVAALRRRSVDSSVSQNQPRARQWGKSSTRWRPSPGPTRGARRAPCADASH